MKAFIAALLVAAVAGQSMDIMRMPKDIMMPKDISTLKYRHFYPMVRDEKMNMMDNYMFPEYEYDTTIYQIEEIMEHPLFSDYMKLPLFRQFWEYPMFQRYVASISFQRYWRIPAFQQYFYSPALFYKYIFPIVQLFKYETSTMNTYGDWTWNKNTYPFTYNKEYNYYNGEQRDLFKHMPTICHYNTIYCKALFEKLYNHMDMMMTYGQQEEMTMPYTTETMRYKHNPYVARMIQGYYERFPTYETERMTMPYTFNKERMFNMYKTEKMMPFHKEMIYETPRMIEDIMTPMEAKYETIRPVMKTFHKKYMPETIIEA